MRAVTFLTKKQVRLCYPQLRFAAVLYAAVPVAVFLLGWLKLYWGIPAAALLAAGVLGLRPGRKEPSAAAAEKAVCVPVWALAVVLVFALAWCFLGGQGGYFYQNSDFANRNGVLHDLVNYPWPVYYQSDSGGFGNHGNPFALVYYICHWLLPALAGKLVLAVTGAAGAAWLAANFALFVWTGLGVFLVFCLLAVTLRPQSWVALLAVCVGFMAFSGLDIVGTVWMHQDVGFHIERWAGVNEYSSMTTCLFWVFNQTVVPWLMTLCVLNEKRVEHYALLGLLALPFGPLPFVGLAVMCLGLGAVRLVQSARAGTLPAFWREVFSRQNLLVLAAILPVFFLYFSANAATTIVPHGGLRHGRFHHARLHSGAAGAGLHGAGQPCAALQCVPHREAVGEGMVPCAAGRFVRGRGDAAGRAVARPDCGVERRSFRHCVRPLRHSEPCGKCLHQQFCGLVFAGKPLLSVFGAVNQKAKRPAPAFQPGGPPLFCAFV